MTLHLLGSAFRQIFDSYIRAYPSAELEFEAEALNFATYISSLDTGRLEQFGIQVNELLAALEKENQNLALLD